MSLFFRKGRHAADAGNVYRAIVEQARAPFLYRDYGVPDTMEGRFEMLVALSCLYFRRLRREDEPARALGQAVFDTMFADMDSSLREIGIGDLSLPKKIRAMGEAFYGRANAYDKALDGPNPEVELADALARNFWPDEGPASEQRAQSLAAWLVAADRGLHSQGREDLVRRGPRFPTSALTVTGAAP